MRLQLSENFKRCPRDLFPPFSLIPIQSLNPEGVYSFPQYPCLVSCIAFPRICYYFLFDCILLFISFRLYLFLLLQRQDIISKPKNWHYFIVKSKSIYFQSKRTWSNTYYWQYKWCSSKFLTFITQNTTYIPYKIVTLRSIQKCIVSSTFLMHTITLTSRTLRGCFPTLFCLFKHCERQFCKLFMLCSKQRASLGYKDFSDCICMYWRDEMS